MNRISTRALAALTLSILLFTPALVGPPPAAAAGPYYVAPWGSDSNSGLAGRPWRTLQKAANSARPGSTVRIRGGTYSGFVMTRSGLAGRKTTFRAYGRERVVVTGNSSTTNVIRISHAHDIMLRGLIVRGARGSRGGAGVRVENGSYRIVLAGLELRRNRSYGVAIIDSSRVHVRHSRIHHNEEGVYVRHGGAGVRIAYNRIHHQNRMVLATPGGHDDHGAVGIALVFTTGKVVVHHNRVWANRAPSPDWGYDGGAFEIYGASNARIVRNIVWDNRVILETGSDGTRCRNNVFARNIAYGATTRDVSRGMVFRCAENMLVTNNTFHRLDHFVFDLKNGGTNFSTSINGLRIVNNIAVMSHGKIYGIESAMPSSVVVDYNLVWHMRKGTIGSVVGRGWTASQNTFTRWTGFDAHGVQGSPRFVNGARHNYRLRWNSPAINRGTSATGYSSAYRGSRPDIGRFERR